MKFSDAIKNFFKNPKIDPVAIACQDAFTAASAAYDAAYDAIEPYTTRAVHQYTILVARRAPDRGSLTLQFDNAYNETVAAYSEPADFEPYTAAFLDAHTAAFDILTASFDTVIAAFAAFRPAHNLYQRAAALLNAYCKAQVFTAEMYAKAVHCALATALEGGIQAIKDQYVASLLEARATNPAETNPESTRAKAATLKAKGDEDSTRATILEQKAKLAETKAAAGIAKAKAAGARLEAVLDAGCLGDGC